MNTLYVIKCGCVSSCTWWVHPASGYRPTFSMLCPHLWLMRLCRKNSRFIVILWPPPKKNAIIFIHATSNAALKFSLLHSNSTFSAISAVSLFLYGTCRDFLQSQQSAMQSYGRYNPSVFCLSSAKRIAGAMSFWQTLNFSQEFPSSCVLTSIGYAF